MKLQPALLGGLLSGVLSALPIINCCCCFWIVSGGLLAAYLAQQSRPDPLPVGDGAVAGLLAGLTGAVVYLIISVPLEALTGDLQLQLFESLVGRIENAPPELERYLEAMRGRGASVAGAIANFIAMLFLGVVFGTIGGLLGAMFFRRESPQSGTA